MCEEHNHHKLSTESLSVSRGTRLVFSFKTKYLERLNVSHFFYKFIIHVLDGLWLINSSSYVQRPIKQVSVADPGFEVRSHFLACFCHICIKMRLKI